MRSNRCAKNVEHKKIQQAWMREEGRTDEDLNHFLYRYVTDRRKDSQTGRREG